MKKFLFILVAILSLSFTTVDAQVYRYRSTEFAYRYVSNGYWTAWSDWESCNVTMTLDLNNDIIKIYSKNTQTYRVTQFLGNYTDNSGGRQVEFKVVDQDGDNGNIRLRIESGGNSQLYVDFADISWVYSGLKRY